ncbi:10971_t:CDS:2, partial [Gigaspora rosea]
DRTPIVTASMSTSACTPLPPIDAVEEFKTENLIDFLREKLQLEEKYLTILRDQEIEGSSFIFLTLELLIKKPGPFELLYGPAQDIVTLINELWGEEQESLKRHFEKVVMEKIEEIRREVKKVRYWYFEERWLSLLGIGTETKKGQRVMTFGAVIDFPLILTQTRRQNPPGKFQKPPNISPDAKPSENEIQEYFIDECKALRALSDIKLYVEDTPSIPLLDTQKPDFIFIRKGRPLDPLNVVAVGIIRKRTGNNFKNADIGHAVAFGEKVLQLQPQRQYVYAVYMASESLTYNTSDPPNDRSTITTVKLVQSISAGRTSIVYEGILENSERTVVVKKAKNASYLPCFTNEKNVLTRLSVLNSSHLLKLLLSNDDTLVMTPLCSKVKNLQINDIENIIKTLKTVHSNFQLVHMDLRKDNLLRDDDDNILIIDWGYSKTQGEDAPFVGALEYMPDNILQSLINEDQINYEPTIDLICLVRSLYLMLHQPLSIGRFSFNSATDNFKKRALDLLNFWAVNGNSEWWNKISSDAEKLKYDDLFENIKKLF